jgi:hypothetical protein
MTMANYAFDTNVFIDACRDATAEAAMLAFLERALPFTVITHGSAVLEEVAARRAMAGHRSQPPATESSETGCPTLKDRESDGALRWQLGKTSRRETYVLLRT